MNGVYRLLDDVVVVLFAMAFLGWFFLLPLMGMLYLVRWLG